MAAGSELRIAVLPGDGVGHEVMDACLTLLDRLQKIVGGYQLAYCPLRAGAAFYRENGVDISDESFAELHKVDAILLGAMGLPEIRYPDGTEIAPHLKMRNEFDLFAGVRPVKAYPNTPRRLLVPFSGSGSEMIGALLAGWDEVVGIERETEYCEIAEARLRFWEQQRSRPATKKPTAKAQKQDPKQIGLFK